MEVIAIVALKVVHDVLQVELIAVSGKKCRYAGIMIPVGMGNEPGIDDHFLTIGNTGDLPAEVQKRLAGLFIIELLNVAAVVDEQTVVRHLHHDELTTVAALLSSLAWLIVHIPAVIGHGDAVHIQLGFAVAAGLRLIGERADGVGVGIHNDARLVVVRMVVGIARVASVVIAVMVNTVEVHAVTFIRGNKLGKAVFIPGVHTVLRFVIADLGIAGVCQRPAVTVEVFLAGAAHDSHIGFVLVAVMTVVLGAVTAVQRQKVRNVSPRISGKCDGTHAQSVRRKSKSRKHRYQHHRTQHRGKDFPTRHLDFLFHIDIPP